MEKPATATRIQFGSFELDRRSGELLKAGSRLRLQEHPLRILEALLDRSGDIVTREELQRRLWPDDTFVDFDNGLNSAINRLRAALGDRADKPRFIETVGGRGYRFIAPVSMPEQSPSTPSAASPPSATAAIRLAVLPFRQLKSDTDTEFLVFSLPDAIASSLSGLESLAVRSTLAAARYAADVPDLSAIATGLDVTLVLGGTVLRIGERVRVSTQLVEVPRGTLLWTSTAEVVLTDMFQVSDGLVRRIVESLAMPLTVRDSRALGRDVPGSGRAYELYLRANGLGQYPATWAEARDLYLECIRADPQYAPAWARLGRIYRLMAKYAASEEPQLMRLAEESFRRALAINPELSLAHTMYAQLEMETGRSVEALGRLLDRARERPVDPQLFVGLVQACRYVGLLGASRAADERARRLDPTVKTSVAYTSMMSGDYPQAIADARANQDPIEGFALAAARRGDEARDFLQKTRRQYGTNRTWALYLDMMLAFELGDKTSTTSLAEACLRLPFRDPEGLFHVCLVLAWLNEPVRALDVLRQSVDAGFACLPGLSCDPALKSLATQPDYESLRSVVEARHRRALVTFDLAAGHQFLNVSLESDRAG